MWAKEGWAAHLEKKKKFTLDAGPPKEPKTANLTKKHKDKAKRKAEKLADDWEIRPVRLLAPGRKKYSR